MAREDARQTARHGARGRGRRQSAEDVVALDAAGFASDPPVFRSPAEDGVGEAGVGEEEPASPLAGTGADAPERLSVR